MDIISLTYCDRLNNGLKDIQALISITCEYYLKRDFAVMIKLRILKWEDCPEISAQTE